MRRWFGATLALAQLPFAIAAANASPQEPAHPCASHALPAERLACYDRAFPPRIDTGAVAAQAERDFGLSRERQRAKLPEALRPADPDRIRARVAALRPAGNGQRLLTLDNGQAWLLVENSSRGRFDPGDEVVVRKAALGSFMLEASDGANLRARRVR